MLSTTTAARRPSRRAPAKRARLQRTSLDGWVQVGRGGSASAAECPGPLNAIGVPAQLGVIEGGVTGKPGHANSLASLSSTSARPISAEGAVRKRKRARGLEQDIASLDAFVFRPGGARARALPHSDVIEYPRGSSLPASPSGQRGRHSGEVAAAPLFSELARYVEASSSSASSSSRSRSSVSPRTARPPKRIRRSYNHNTASSPAATTAHRLQLDSQARLINSDFDDCSSRSDTRSVSSEDPTRVNLNEVT